MAITTRDTAFLKSVPLLGDLSDTERTRFASYLEAKDYEAGQVVIWEGQSHDAVHIIVSGAVVVSKLIRGEVEGVLAHLDPGQFFGELNLIDARLAGATVTAEEPTRLVRIDHARLNQLWKEDEGLFSKLAWALLRDLASKLRATNVKVQEAVEWGLDATNMDP